MKRNLIFIFLLLAIGMSAQDICDRVLYQPPLVGGTIYQHQLYIPPIQQHRNILSLEDVKIKPFGYATQYTDGVLYYQWLRWNNNGSSTPIKLGCEGWVDVSGIPQGTRIIARVWLIQNVETPRYLVTSYLQNYVIPHTMTAAQEAAY
jgi:hypothetical protein